MSKLKKIFIVLLLLLAIPILFAEDLEDDSALGNGQSEVSKINYSIY